MDYKARYDAWLTDPAISEEDKQELRSLAGDEAELQDRFYRELGFGTAGLRGVIGMGANRMNRYVVRRATQGYANTLLAQTQQPSVAIAYDPRRYSDQFALEAALVLCANGIKTHLFPQMRSVPQLSFAIGHLGADGGIVITASHNPAKYNGYKVYGKNGAQIGPEQAQAVTEAIAAVPSFSAVRSMEKEAALAAGLLILLDEKEDRAYFSYTEGLSLDPSLWAQGDFGLVYTPLHGTGALAVPRILQDMGLKNCSFVEAQMQPDPSFSTVSAPNPEQPDALALAIAQAKATGAQLVLATDPDSDRLGVAVRGRNGDFLSLTGNQIGALLFHHIVKQLEHKGLMPKNPLVVRSMVTGHMVDAIAAKHGVTLKEVLTGFRYIGEIVDNTSRTGAYDFLFGFEESFGYLRGTQVRDKDAICAAMLLTECALWHNSQGHSLLDALDNLYAIYGRYLESTHSYSLEGLEGQQKIAATMAMMRENPPARLGGREVTALRDYQRGLRRSKEGEETPLGLPNSDIVYLELADGGWVCVRPSGTEPKLKIYVGVTGPSREQVERELKATHKDIRALLDPVLL